MLGIHTSLARIIPEMELSEGEARDMATAYADVAQYYPMLRLPDKYAAVLTFGTQLATVYGTRFVAWRLRMLSTPTPQPTPQQQTTETLARVLNPAPQPPNPSNGANRNPPPAAVRTGEVPGVGNVEFPPDHPLVRGNKLN